MAVDTIITDELLKAKRYLFYRLIDEILEVGEMSEELLKKITEFLKTRWAWDYQINRWESRYLGKN
jgi:hypothetical protein